MLLDNFVYIFYGFLDNFVYIFYGFLDDFVYNFYGFLDNFVDNFYGFFCFAFYAVQILLPSTKVWLPFLGGGCKSLS